MYELYPYFTNDGSVGLFSPDADDIYHSTYGALTEAYEKFIIPANIENFLQTHDDLKVLDICFGIGYNTKSFLNFILEKFLDKKFRYKNYYNASIGTDNTDYINKIDTNNKKCKIFIHAIDTDKNLAYLSPFFITGKNNLKNHQLNFEHEKIQRMLSCKITPKFKIKDEVNILLLQKLFENIDIETEDILFSKKYSQYFDKKMKALFKFYKNNRYKTTSLRQLSTFLHNIYYKYLSTCNKSASKALKLIDFDFRLNIEDARQAIINDTNKYHYIFLDAFTPAKCPCLWTFDFFKLLYEHLEDDGMILTYSNSALVRKAFLQVGFNVGKIFSENANKFTGTVATKNSKLIKHELSEYDLGLMKTKAGIFYRDENLTLSNEAIIAQHKIDVENSNLISSSRFIKDFSKQ